MKKNNKIKFIICFSIILIIIVIFFFYPYKYNTISQDKHASFS